MNIITSPRVDNESSIEWEQQVAVLAHQIWESRGHPAGTAEEDWFEAQRQFRVRGENPDVPSNIISESLDGTDSAAAHNVGVASSFRVSSNV